MTTAALPLIAGETYQVRIDVIADDDIDYGFAIATFIH